VSPTHQNSIALRGCCRRLLPSSRISRSFPSIISPHCVFPAEKGGREKESLGNWEVTWRYAYRCFLDNNVSSRFQSACKSGYCPSLKADDVLVGRTRWSRARSRKKEEDCYARIRFYGVSRSLRPCRNLFSRLSGEGETERECLPYVKSARTRATVE